MLVQGMLIDHENLGCSTWPHTGSQGLSDLHERPRRCTLIGYKGVLGGTGTAEKHLQHGMS